MIECGESNHGKMERLKRLDKHIRRTPKAMFIYWKNGEIEEIRQAYKKNSQSYVYLLRVLQFSGRKLNKRTQSPNLPIRTFCKHMTSSLIHVLNTEELCAV